MVGHLVARYERAAMGPQCRLVDPCILRRNHEGDDRLALIAMRGTDNSRLGNPGMLQQHGFDVGGGNVDAGSLDNVVVASDKMKIAVLVDKADVTGAEIAVGGEGGRVVLGAGAAITGRHKSAYFDRAGFARRQGLAALPVGDAYR